MMVSVIIAAYNAEQTIGKCLAGCLRQTLPAHEIIVVDDGSTDGTRECVERLAEGDAIAGSSTVEPSQGGVCANPPVRYILQANAGPAAARNRGAALATGEFIAFTDSDCVPDGGWLEALLARFDDETVAGVGGTYGIMNPDSYLARMVHEEIVMRHERMGEKVDFLGSFNVTYRKRAFDAVGGFDESFRAASGEDNDLAYRIADTGGTLRFTRDAVVAHYHPERLWPYLRTQYRHGYWRMKLYAKHVGRARGDHYAGLADQMAPSVAVALVLWSGLTLLSSGGFSFADASRAGNFPFYLSGLFMAASFLLYLALQGWKGLPMARRIGPAAVVAFPAMLFLRDVARSHGAFRGIWAFTIPRKGRKT